MPTCENAAADTKMTKSTNNNERMNEMIRMLFSWRISLPCPVLLGRGRVAWIDRHDFRADTLTFVSLANGSDRDFLILEAFKSGQKCSVVSSSNIVIHTDLLRSASEGVVDRES